jgi:hypothetical protein
MSNGRSCFSDHRRRVKYYVFSLNAVLTYARSAQEVAGIRQTMDINRQMETRDGARKALCNALSQRKLNDGMEGVRSFHRGSEMIN